MADSEFIPDPVFEKPQWKLVEDIEERLYGYVANSVSVMPLESKWHYKNLQIPTGLFSTLEFIYTPSEIEILKKKQAKLYLIQDVQNNWSFVTSINSNDLAECDQYYRELWQYTPKTVPGWLITK